MDILNIAAYKFCVISNREVLQPLILERCLELNLKGNVLLAEEGINFSVAGSVGDVEEFLRFLAEDARFGGLFTDLEVKRSFGPTQPFGRMVVRLPKEIITMRKPMVRPGSGRAPAVEPAQLKEWLEQGRDDEGREVILVDTRNTYEVDYGKFEGAVDLRLETFSAFPDAISNIAQSENIREKTIVTYCTGGIRCEKAALFMQHELNLEHVYQLQGGILNYFEVVGGEHWDGECFVFDERVALDPQLRPTKNPQRGAGPVRDASPS